MNSIIQVSYRQWIILEELWEQSHGTIDSDKGVWLLLNKAGQVEFTVFVTHKPAPFKKYKDLMKDIVLEMMLSSNEDMAG